MKDLSASHTDGSGSTMTAPHVAFEEDHRFRRVVEYAPNAMILVDAKGLIEMVNAETEKVFGYTRDELLGQPVDVLVPDRFRHHHAGLRNSFIAARTTAHGTGTGSLCPAQGWQRVSGGNRSEPDCRRRPCTGPGRHCRYFRPQKPSGKSGKILAGKKSCCRKSITGSKTICKSFTVCLICKPPM